MTEDIAQTLKDLPRHPLVKAALSHSRPLEDIIDEYMAAWQADLVERKPALVYTKTDSGEPLYKTKTLDLFTVLLALAENGQVISINKYQGMREGQVREDQCVIDPEHRYGQVKRVTSHKEVGSFSALIWDLSVETTLPDESTELGDWRNFALVDVYGRMRPEWEVGSISIDITPEQEKFFKSLGMEILSAPIKFENFVHPQLYKAAFGQRYAIGNVLAECVPIEREYWKGIEKSVSGLLAGKGIDLKEECKMRRGPSAERYSSGSKGEDVIVPAIEGRLSFPMKSGEYPWYGLDKDGNKRVLPQSYDRLGTDDLKDLGWYIYRRKNDLSYTLGPRIRAPLRATELALFLRLTDGEDLESLARDSGRLAACQARIAGIADGVGWPVPEPKPSQFVDGEGPYHAISYGNGFTMHYRLLPRKTKLVKSPEPE